MEILLIYILKDWKGDLSSYGKGQLSMKNFVKGFHGGDEYVAILYEVSTLGPSYTRYSSIPNTIIKAIASSFFFFFYTQKAPLLSKLADI